MRAVTSNETYDVIVIGGRRLGAGMAAADDDHVIEGAPPPLGEPMEILPPMLVPPRAVPKATWTTNAGDLPPVPNSRGYRHPRVCPECDSRATKRVFRHENKVMLACPVCAFAWEYRP